MRRTFAPSWPAMIRSVPRLWVESAGGLLLDVIFAAVASEVTGRDGSEVGCGGAETTGAGVETGGVDSAGTEAVGAAIVGAAAGILAAGSAGCFRARKNSTPTKTTAAAEAITTSVVEFDLAGCFGRGDGGVNLAVVRKDSSAGAGAGWCGGFCAGSCAFVGVVRSLPRGGVLRGSLPGGAIAGGTFSARVGLGGAGVGKTCAGMSGTG